MKDCKRKRSDQQIRTILGKVKVLARRYRALTGKPLGVTGEIAEYEAAKRLKLELVSARQEGYDAIARTGKKRRRFSIKGRCLLPNCKPGQRLGMIDVTKPFDAVLLVLMDERFDATEIYEASRWKVVKAIRAPGSKARNERGALSVSKFKSIGKCIWER